MKSFFIKALILLGIVAVGWIGFSAYKEIEKKKTVQSEIQKLQEEADKISRENSDLEEKISYLESKDYREREAKDKLNLQSPGENVVVIKPSLSNKEELPKGQESEPQVKTQNVSNPKAWWNYFFAYSN